MFYRRRGEEEGTEAAEAALGLKARESMQLLMI